MLPGKPLLQAPRNLYLWALHEGFPLPAACLAALTGHLRFRAEAFGPSSPPTAHAPGAWPSPYGEPARLRYAAKKEEETRKPRVSGQSEDLFKVNRNGGKRGYEEGPCGAGPWCLCFRVWCPVWLTPSKGNQGKQKDPHLGGKTKPLEQQTDNEEKPTASRQNKDSSHQEEATSALGRHKTRHPPKVLSQVWHILLQLPGPIVVVGTLFRFVQGKLVLLEDNKGHLRLFCAAVWVFLLLGGRGMNLDNCSIGGCSPGLQN